MLRHLLLAASLALPCVSLRAEPVSLPNTEVIHLESESNGVAYKLYVSYPRDINESDHDYPLIVSLDADYSFAIVRNIVEHLSDRRDTPPMVIVSIGYAGSTTMKTYRMNRSRDYTPLFDPDDGYGPVFQEHSGGAPAFLAFIRDEVLPLMNARYRAGGKRALVGHSYGGLFASWAMLEEPELFDGYIVVSPSLWYHDGWIFKQETEAFAERTRLDATAYFAVGDFEGGSMVPDLERYAGRLEARKLDGFRIRGEVLSDETHNSVFPRAVSNGIRMLWPRETGRAWPGADTR